MQLFGVEFPLELEPRYNITPGSFVVTLRAGSELVVEPAVLKWGLIPSWAKDPAIGNRLINARVETVQQKPSFRAAFRRRRCVVLADGFYEWRSMRDGKVPYFITLAEDGPLAMAGLWEHWQGADGEEIQTCTILTTEANRRLVPLHSRMPIVLAPAGSRRWIGQDADEPDSAHKILRASDNDRLEFWPVSRSVNNPRNDGADLVKPVNLDRGETGFPADS